MKYTVKIKGGTGRSSQVYLYSSNLQQQKSSDYAQHVEHVN